MQKYFFVLFICITNFNVSPTARNARLRAPFTKKAVPSKEFICVLKHACKYKTTYKYFLNCNQTAEWTGKDKNMLNKSFIFMKGNIN